MRERERERVRRVSFDLSPSRIATVRTQISLASHNSYTYTNLFCVCVYVCSVFVTLSIHSKNFQALCHDYLLLHSHWIKCKGREKWIAVCKKGKKGKFWRHTNKHTQTGLYKYLVHEFMVGREKNKKHVVVSVCVCEGAFVGSCGQFAHSKHQSIII